MPRVKLSEYRAKKIILGDAYAGVSWRTGASPSALPEGSWVVKVDEGVKKRMKQGLVALSVPSDRVASTAAPWEEKGFGQFLAEPMLAHDASAERYLSLERVRDGLRVLYAAEGGIDVEAHPEKVKHELIRDEADAARVAGAIGVPQAFLTRLVRAFDEDHFTFLEINPLVVEGREAFALDAAVLVDSAASYFVRGAWSDADVVGERTTHPAEKRVAELQATTPASLKLSVVNPDGSLFFLLSGGGGSIVIADEAASAGVGKEIGNYGEYSGGPTREETYLYAKEVIALMLASGAAKKALVIAGGVANFTNVASTFDGIIDALSERADDLRAGNVRVFVRRGGPNEEAGLAHMKAFLEKEQLFGSVEGSDAIITDAVDKAITHVRHDTH